MSLTITERNRVTTWTLRAILALSLLAAASITAYGQTQDDFFNDAVVQEIHLTVNTKDWQSLKDHADQDTYYPADVSWQGVTVHNAGIRSRGHVTRNGIKPSLRVDMNRYVSGQDFLGLKAIILKNVYDDPSFIRESVSMKMLARMGITAPREVHARLYVNNVFVGLYVIVESVDRTFVERIYGPEEGAKDSGGYLYKYQKVSNYQFAYLGEDLAPYAQMFEPKTRETDSLVSLYKPLEEMIRVVNQTPDRQFLTAAGSQIDLAEAMKLVAVEDFMAEVDGFLGAWTMNNFYLYRGKNGVAQLIPWDTSQTFSSLAHPIDFDLLTNVLTIRSIAVPNLWQIYLDTLTKCAEIASEVPDGDHVGWLEREIRNEVALIDPIVPQDPVAPFTPDQYHSAVDSMVQFAQLRSGFVACQVANAGDPAGPQRDCAALLDPPPIPSE